MTTNEFNLLSQEEQLKLLKQIAPYGSLKVGVVKIIHYKMHDFYVTACRSARTGKCIAIRATFSERVLNVHPNPGDFEDKEDGHIDDIELEKGKLN